MQKSVTPKNRSEGFLLLDSSMNLVLFNRAAAQILIYPQTAETQANLDGYLVGKIRSTLLSKQSSEGLDLVSQFNSGRRRYLCRSFKVDAIENSPTSFAVILERASAATASLAQLSEKFNLTNRELEVAHFLLQGLTSKEIGMRMHISANTVKAFLRSIMIKMGVSTRSGVVGKVLTANL